MEDSIFTKIIKGEIPAHKIYEDATTLAFLTIEPIHPGHTLVIPKRQVDHLWDLNEVEYQAVMATTQKIAQRIRDILQPKRVGLHVEGTQVPHAHVHVFPFQNETDFWDRPSGTATDPDLADIAAKLRI